MASKARSDSQREIFLNVMNPLITVVGVLANLFVVFVLVTWERSRSNRTVTQLFALNLAAADLFFVLSITMDSQETHWQYGTVLCKVKRGLDHLNFHASILFLTVMSFDRMLATVYLMKMRVHRTRKRAAYVCAAIWILSLITISPIFMYATVHKTNNGHARCHVKFPGLTKDEKWTGSAEMLTGAVLNPPLLELTTVADGVAVGSGDDFVFSDDATSGGGANAETSDTEVTSLVTTLATTTTESFEDWMIRMRPKPKERNNVTNASLTDDEIDPMFHRKCENPEKHSSKYQVFMWTKFVMFFVVPVITITASYAKIMTAATKKFDRMPANQKKMREHMVATILAMVIAFIVCWTPLLVWNLLTTVSYWKSTFVGDCQWYQSIFIVLAYSNSALNPLVYWMASRNFRQKIVSVFAYYRNGRQLKYLTIAKKGELTAVTRNTSSMKSYVRDSSAKKDSATTEMLTMKNINDTIKEVVEEEAEILKAETGKRDSKSSSETAPLRSSVTVIEQTSLVQDCGDSKGETTAL